MAKYWTNNLVAFVASLLPNSKTIAILWKDQFVSTYKSLFCLPYLKGYYKRDHLRFNPHWRKYFSVKWKTKEESMKIFSLLDHPWVWDGQGPRSARRHRHRVHEASPPRQAGLFSLQQDLTSWRKFISILFWGTAIPQEIPTYLDFELKWIFRCLCIEQLLSSLFTASSKQFWLYRLI